MMRWLFDWLRSVKKPEALVEEHFKDGRCTRCGKQVVFAKKHLDITGEFSSYVYCPKCGWRIETTCDG